MSNQEKIKTAVNNHDIAREIDIQKVVSQIADSGIDYYDNPCGYDIYKCPFCGEHGRPYQKETMQTIQHSKDCIWLIAKDLLIK